MIYMDNAATSFPKPANVIDAMNECLTYWCVNPGRAGYKYTMAANKKVFQTRQKIAELINADPLRIIMTYNCTHALNLGIKGILKANDQVLTTMMEHNSVLRPLYGLREKGISTSIINCDIEGNLSLKALRKAITPRTKMIISTFSSNVTGTKMPIKEIGKIAKEKGIVFMVDGAQGAGMEKIDVEEENIDILAASGHKSLLGPQGSGFLYIKKNLKLKHILEGGTGSHSLEVAQPINMPEGYEAGTLNLPGIVGLYEGLEYINERGIDRIRAREIECLSYLYEELNKLNNIKIYGPKKQEEKTGIIAFNLLDKVSESVTEELDKRFDICMRAGYHCAPLAHRAIGTTKSGCVRASVGPFTTDEEIEKTIMAIRTIAK